MQFSKSTIEIEFIADESIGSSFFVNAQDLLIALEDSYYLGDECTGDKAAMDKQLDLIRLVLKGRTGIKLSDDFEHRTSEIVLKFFERGDAFILFMGKRLYFGNEIFKTGWSDGPNRPLQGCGGSAYVTDNGTVVFRRLEWMS